MTEETHDEYQVCYKHPDRKTLLRCNKCSRPICLECAVQTPTGYRCKDCVKNQQKVFNTSLPKDYIIGAVISAVLSYVGAFVIQLIPILPAFVSALIFGSAFGKIICSAVHKAVQKRRSDTLTKVLMAAAAVGGLLAESREIILCLNLLSLGQAGALIQIISDVLYIVVLCFTIRSEMTGMVFRR